MTTKTALTLDKKEMSSTRAAVWKDLTTVRFATGRVQGMKIKLRSESGNSLTKKNKGK